MLKKGKAESYKTRNMISYDVGVTETLLIKPTFCRRYMMVKNDSVGQTLVFVQRLFIRVIAKLAIGVMIVNDHL